MANTALTYDMIGRMLARLLANGQWRPYGMSVTIEWPEHALNGMIDDFCERHLVPLMAASHGYWQLSKKHDLPRVAHLELDGMALDAYVAGNPSIVRFDVSRAVARDAAAFAAELAEQTAMYQLEAT